METKQARGEIGQVGNVYTAGDLTVITTGFEITDDDERVAELVMLRRENALLRAFVAAYDKNEASINVKGLGSVLVSNQETREAVRVARLRIK